MQIMDLSKGQVHKLRLAQRSQSFVLHKIRWCEWEILGSSAFTKIVEQSRARLYLALNRANITRHTTEIADCRMKLLTS